MKSGRLRERNISPLKTSLRKDSGLNVFSKAGLNFFHRRACSFDRKRFMPAQRKGLSSSEPPIGL
jgi:hypothetical protein